MCVCAYVLAGACARRLCEVLLGVLPATACATARQLAFACAVKLCEVLRVSACCSRLCRKAV